MSRALQEILVAADHADKAAKAAKDPALPNVTHLSRQRHEGTLSAAEDLSELIRRIGDASIEEIDRVILELQSVRGMLRREGERVNHELNGYVSLNHASLTAMRVIGDSLKQWKTAPANNGVRSTDC